MHWGRSLYEIGGPSYTVIKKIFHQNYLSSNRFEINLYIYDDKQYLIKYTQPEIDLSYPVIKKRFH